MENNKFFQWLEKNLLTPLSKLATYKLVRAIMAAGVTTIPFTIVGSMFLVLNALPTAIPALAPLFEATVLRFSDLYMTANIGTMGILALYFNLVIGYEYTKLYAEEDGLNLNPLNGALLSMMAFIMAIPSLIIEDGSFAKVHVMTEESQIINGWIMGGSGPSRLGTGGIFTGIILAILSVHLYRLCVKKEWVISMPEGVPEGVSRAFTALIPAFIVSFVVILLNGSFAMLGTDIFGVIGIPFQFVTNLTDSWLGVVLIFFLAHALWIVGIHGANIVISLIQPILLGNLALNAEGAVLPLAGAFQKTFVEIGGSGGTLLLAIFIAYFAKSEQLKALGKVSWIPSVFNINEPLIFGLPIIYNPYLAVPFMLSPVVTASIGYFSIKWGLCGPIIAQAPWPTPVGIIGFIGSGGDWRMAMISILCAFVSFAIYYPFIKAYDKKLVVDEQAA